MRPRVSIAPIFAAPIFTALLCTAPLSSCGSTVPSACGDGTDPVVVTSLNGVLDGSTLAVEIVPLIPETCEETGERIWMLFEDPDAMVTLGTEPTGTLRRGGIDIEEMLIFFREHNVGVRLEYPGDVVGPDVRFVWFSMGTTLRTVDCTASPFECSIQE